MRPFILIFLLVAAARANTYGISPSNSCMQFGRDCPGDSEPYTVNFPFPVETVKVAFAGDHYSSGPVPQINVVNTNNYAYDTNDWNQHQAGPPAPVETVKIAFTGDHGNNYNHHAQPAYNPTVYQPQVQSWEDDSYQKQHQKRNDDGSYGVSNQAAVSQSGSSSTVKIAFGSDHQMHNNGRYARSLVMPVQFTGGAPPAPLIRNEMDRYQSHHAPALVAAPAVVPSYAEAPVESVRATVPESSFHISFGSDVREAPVESVRAAVPESSSHISFGSDVREGGQRQASSFFSDVGSGHSSSSYGSHVPIVRHNEDITPGSSHVYDYSTANGINHNEVTFVRQPGYNGYGASLEPTADLVKKGTYSYTSPEGKTTSMSYEADANGFRPVGSHLPVAPQPLAPTRAVRY